MRQIFIDKDDLFDFGKYKNETFEYVLDCDVKYINWCIEEKIIGLEFNDADDIWDTIKDLITNPETEYLGLEELYYFKFGG